MALSGTYVLTRTALEIYQEVLEILQVIGDGETISTAMKTKITPTLNNMIKSWEAQGMHLWTDKEGTMFLQVAKAEYDFTSALVHKTNSYTQTTLAVAASAGASTVTVTTDADITNGDAIGILDENNDLFWTTVNGVPSSDVVTLTDTLDNDSNAGGVVFNYTDSIIPVRRILNVRRKEANDYEIPINFESRGDYFDLPNKAQQGLPIQAYYSRQEAQGIMYLWTTPDNASSVINFTYERETQIITQDSDNFDMPSYWFQALVFNVASLLTYKFSTSLERRQEIKADAAIFLDEALAFDDAVYPITVKVEKYG